MKRIYNCVYIFLVLLTGNAYCQNVGIGTVTPLNKFHVTDTVTTPGTMGYFNLVTSTSGDGIAVEGRSNGNSSGTYYGVYGSSLTTGPGHAIGTIGETYGANSGIKIGLEGLAYGSNGDNYGTRGWAFGNSTGTNYGIYGIAYGASKNWAGYFSQGNVYIGDKLGIGVPSPLYKVDVTSNDTRTGSFINTIANEDFVGLYASCNSTSNFGYGLIGNGGFIGVEGNALMAGGGGRVGLSGTGQGGNVNYGVSASGAGGNLAYGIYAKAELGLVNYAGYFSGDVITTGAYFPSDRKLKSSIIPLKNALGILQKLNPSVYRYKTAEFNQMHLPDGLQYGLIADEIALVMPGAIKKAVQPAEYEHQNPKGKKISDEVEFNAVNYAQMIPVLIAAVKEQQSIISDQQQKIEDMERRLALLEKR
ncbi:MAG: tail fiber domain-containing protein [Ferruginibacter sp.]